MTIFYQTISLNLARYQILSFKVTDHPGLYEDEHVVIIETIEASEPEQAKGILAGHPEHFMNVLTPICQDHAGDGNTHSEWRTGSIR